MAQSPKMTAAKTVYFDNETAVGRVGSEAVKQLAKWGRFKLVKEKKQADLIFFADRRSIQRRVHRVDQRADRDDRCRREVRAKSRAELQRAGTGARCVFVGDRSPRWVVGLECFACLGRSADGNQQRRSAVGEQTEERDEVGVGELEIKSTGLETRHSEEESKVPVRWCALQGTDFARKDGGCAGGRQDALKARATGHGAIERLRRELFGSPGATLGMQK